MQEKSYRGQTRVGFLEISAFFNITALSMNILHAGDKLPVQRVFFKK